MLADVDDIHCAPPYPKAIISTVARKVCETPLKLMSVPVTFVPDTASAVMAPKLQVCGIAMYADAPGTAENDTDASADPSDATMSDDLMVTMLVDNTVLVAVQTPDKPPPPCLMYICCVLATVESPAR